jgi:hypothetical protein
MEERQFLCSGCLAVTPESAIHVVPCFNQTLGDYVTTYRCGACWQVALKETETRVAQTQDPAEFALLGAFFERHGVTLHEFKRGDPLAVVRPLMVRMIDLMRLGAIRLPAGATAK